MKHNFVCLLPVLVMTLKNLGDDLRHVDVVTYEIVMIVKFPLVVPFTSILYTIDSPSGLECRSARDIGYQYHMFRIYLKILELEANRH